MEFVFAVDDLGETISKLEIDTEAYTGEALSCSEKPTSGRRRSGVAPGPRVPGLTLAVTLEGDPLLKSFLIDCRLWWFRALPENTLFCPNCFRPIAHGPSCPGHLPHPPGSRRFASPPRSELQAPEVRCWAAEQSRGHHP